MIRRRFARYLEENLESGPRTRGEDASRPGIDPTTGKPKKFAYAPNLVVVDGGAPQVAAAQAVLDDLGIDDVSLVGLAKRLEEVWLPGEAVPRDPAAHLGRPVPAATRARRGAPLRDHLPPREALADDDDLRAGRHPRPGRDAPQGAMRTFGSLKRLRAASADDIAEVPGIGPRTAEAIVVAAADRARSAVNVTTGEVRGVERS